MENRSCEPTGDEAGLGINTELTGAGQGDEVETGNREIKAVMIKRFLPKLFWRIIRKQSAT